VQLATLKQRTERQGQPAELPRGSQAHRLVPLSDHHYVSQLQMMVATLKIPLERRNKRTGRTEKAASGTSPTGQYGPGLAKRLKRPPSTG
jgi:hypothetical protein